MRYTPIEIPGSEDCKRVTVGGDRHYQTPDGVFPSVTTFLKNNTDQSFLDEWKERVGEKEANRISRTASGFGTRMHEFIENYIKAGKRPLPKKYGYDVNLVWDSLSKEFEENLSVVHMLETFMWSKTLGLAGTVDCIGVWDGKLSCIDFKTSLKTKYREWIDSYFIQSLLYSVMFQERTSIQVEQLIIPVFSVHGQSKIFKAKPNDYYNKASEIFAQSRRG